MPKITLNAKYQNMFDNAVKCRYYLVSGGRGSGKSYAGALRAAVGFASCGVKNQLYLRQTLVSAHISIIPEFHAKIRQVGYGNIAEVNKTEIRNIVMDKRLFFRGMQENRKDNEANLKSVFDVSELYIDEAQEVTDEKAFDRVDLSIRDTAVENRVFLFYNPTDVSHWIYRRFFDSMGVADDFNGVVGNTCYIHTTYLDNADNLPQDYISIAEKTKNEDVGKYENIWLGLWRKDNGNALWKKASMIDPYRVGNAPAQMERVVVAIDPAVTKKRSSCSTGIVIAGAVRRNGETHYYVLDDRSGVMSPKEWSDTAVNAYSEYDADRIVAEVNQGGDMVEQTLRNCGKRVSYRGVRAMRGKVVRAEPIAELYERGLVHHVGNFAQLENEMCTYCGYDGEKSPDRMDALVWALTDLSGRYGTSGVIA